MNYCIWNKGIIIIVIRIIIILILLLLFKKGNNLFYLSLFILYLNCLICFSVSFSISCWHRSGRELTNYWWWVVRPLVKISWRWLFTLSLPSSKGNFRDNVDVLCTEQLVFPDKHLEVCRCQMHCFWQFKVIGHANCQDMLWKSFSRNTQGFQ